MEVFADAVAVEQATASLILAFAETDRADFAFVNEGIERAAGEVEQGAAGAVIAKLWL